MLVALNFAATAQPLVGLPGGLAGAGAAVVCGTHRSGALRLLDVDLAPCEALVARLDDRP
jgi:hypothetical protein